MFSNSSGGFEFNVSFVHIASMLIESVFETSAKFRRRTSHKPNRMQLRR